ncbi:unnamed protein product, partial [Amoebophrya sp. A25]|eukprot:GSA25T00003612001.1
MSSSTSAISSSLVLASPYDSRVELLARRLGLQDVRDLEEVERYLLANDWNEEAALAQWQRTGQWRQERQRTYSDFLVEDTPASRLVMANGSTRFMGF